MAKDDIGGVWRTISGRRVFIKDGQDLATAMRESGKFKNIGKNPKVDRKKNKYATNNEGGIDDNTSRFADEAIKHWEKENQKYKEKYGKDDEMALKFKSQWEKEKSNRLYGEKSAKMNETMDRRQAIIERLDKETKDLSSYDRYNLAVSKLENEDYSSATERQYWAGIVEKYKKDNDFHYAGEELYSDDPNRFGDKMRKYNEKMNPTKNEQTFEVSELKKKAMEILPKEDIDTHEGDLYIKKTPESTELINKMKNKDSGLLSTFKDQQTGETWYEIPFANMEDDYESKYLKARNEEARYEKALGEYTGGKNYGEKIKTTGNDYLPKAKKVETAGTSNRKEVSDNIQAHILDYYDNPVDFMEQMDAMDWLPTRWHAGQELAKGGSYLIYNGDMADFLDSLNINPKGKKFSEDKSFQMYTSLIGRESERLYNRLEKLFDQYKKEHKNSNATLEDFRKWFK